MPKKFYAVKRGSVPGIYTSWPEAQPLVKGYQNARFKGFATMVEAEAFMNEPDSGGAQRVKTSTLLVHVKPKTVKDESLQNNLIDLLTVSASDLKIDPELTYILTTDGGCRGNPGPSSSGGVIYDAITTKPIASFSKFLGTKTNNEAEYFGLIDGLELAKSLGISRLECRLDSKLIFGQVFARWNVDAENLKPLNKRAFRLSKQFMKCTGKHHLREFNKDADFMCNYALDNYESNVGSKKRKEVCEDDQVVKKMKQEKISLCEKVTNHQEAEK